MDNRERFEEKIARVPESGCWIWLSGLSKDGYGRFWFGEQTIPAHRASWLLYKGALPEALFVCHRCDVTCCVNPEHLFLGTQKDNVDDALQKGRMKFGQYQRERTHCSKGHELSGSNVRFRDETIRVCRSCERERSRRRRSMLGAPGRG